MRTVRWTGNNAALLEEKDAVNLWKVSIGSVTMFWRNMGA